MEKLIGRIDGIADIDAESVWAKRLERTAFVFLVIMALAAPHSIAATQTAWIIGMLATVARFFIKRPVFRFGKLELLFATFFLWSIVTAAVSYAPDISFGKLRNVSLFLVFYFAYVNVRTSKAGLLLAFALIASSMVAVIWTPIERIIGRGVEVHALAPNSPLSKAVPNKDEQPISEGRTVIDVDGKKVNSPEALLTAIEAKEASKLKVYHTDYYSTVTVHRDELLPGNNALERLGIGSAARNHNWRSAGFYGHYVTFAEVMQLIAALAFGILVSLLAERWRSGKSDTVRSGWILSIVLAVCVAGMSFALLLTVTRASQAAFLISSTVIVLLSGNRKLILLAAALAIPILIGGAYMLQKSRNVGYVDASDNSTTWRMAVYREGLDLWTKSPRNFIFGVGMDSIQRYSDEWHLFDNGRLPKGHFHSTPLQLAVERGLPALLLWLAIIGVLFHSLYRGIHESKIQNLKSEMVFGLLLGCLGVLVGFFSSGLVHYNLGDGEVAIVFFMVMGIGKKVVGSKQ